jgi:hypothetical protein
MTVLGSKCFCGRNATVFEGGEQFCNDCYLKKNGRR